MEHSILGAGTEPDKGMRLTKEYEWGEVKSGLGCIVLGFDQPKEVIELSDVHDRYREMRADMIDFLSSVSTLVTDSVEILLFL